ncbi:hypothetical protein CERZMDRAFT_97739 [Cercospora zeae-maydis SCOH1-5]|uniref:Uncharacterized protein n=1 Tax=Cercospora zeae-maydis SCOH1-5 TaxID=717836 RepID=A0A6A6FGG4_9PEZI|nr:hypothetical protein CERZMDRAFT_97739 [Cercospora zeae-maydis SCOH1-5]
MELKHLWTLSALGSVADALHFPRQAYSNASSTAITANADTSSSTASGTSTLTTSSPTLTTAPTLITHSANSTSLGNTTSDAHETCCYVFPNAVGINSWYSSAMEFPVATVITTWVQYGNGSAIPQNSTTRTVANATAPYGWYSWMTGDASTASGTTTETFAFTTNTITRGTSTQFLPVTESERFSGVPNTLLPANALMYASSQVLSASTMAYSLQHLTFTSPTPYLWFSQMWIQTSRACDPSSRLPGGNRPVMQTSTIVMPLPSSIANADFTFEEYMQLANMTEEGNSGTTYHFSLPEDLPQFLADIPEIIATWPFIGTCLPGPGAGEPTVHIPVSQLTARSDVTMTLPGTLTTPSQPTTTAGGDPRPSPTLSGPGSDVTETHRPTPTDPTFDDDAPAGTALPIEDGTGSPDDSAPGTPDEGDGNEPSLPEPTPGSPDEEDESPPAVPEPLPEGDDSSDTSPAPAPDADDEEEHPVSPSVPDDNDDSPDSEPAETPGEDNGNDSPPAPIADTEDDVSEPPSAGGAIASGIGLAPTPPGSPAQPIQPGEEVVVGGGSVTANPDGSFEIGSETLQPGGAAVTVDGNTLSLAPSGTAIVINDATTPIAATAAEISLGDGVLRAGPSGNIEIGGQTLQPGGEAVVVGGTTLSLAPDATALVIDESTTPVAAASSPQITLPAATLTAQEGGAFVIDGQTLQEGSNVVAGGSTFSLASDGGAIVVNGQITPIETAAGETTTAAPAVAAGAAGELIAGSDTLSFTGFGSEFVFGGSSTLDSARGKTVVVNGQTLSLLNPSQIVVISGTSTRTLDLSPTTTVVVTRTMSREGGDGSSQTTSTTLLATGAAAGRQSGGGKLWVWASWLVMTIFIVAL